MIFHHIGYATQEIQRELTVFEEIGYKKCGFEFIDEIQGVKGCFLEGDGSRIELLENLPGHSTLTPWLTSSIKAYHFAYFVTNIAEAIEHCKSKKALLISNPSSSVAFGGRLICFMMLRNRQLIELIEE